MHQKFLKYKTLKTKVLGPESKDLPFAIICHLQELRENDMIAILNKKASFTTKHLQPELATLHRCLLPNGPGGTQGNPREPVPAMSWAEETH